MNKKTLLELLYAKNFKKTLKYMRRYEAHMRNGVSYDKLKQMMEYDYRLYLEKQLKKESVDITSENAIIKLHNIDNLYTNIESEEDALCKFKALALAKENLEE